MEKKPKKSTQPSRKAAAPRARRSTKGTRRSAAPRAKKIADVTAPAVVAAVSPAPASVLAAVSVPAPASIARRTRLPWRMLAAFFAFTLVMTAVGGFIIRAVNAATFQGPSQAAPGGNIPLTIWNRAAATTRQANSAIDIDGGGPAPGTSTGISVGTNTLDMGSAAGGQNVIYGVAAFANMHAADNLLLLQTATAGPTYTTRFSVDKNGKVVTPADLNSAQLFVTQNATVGSATYVVTPAASNLIYGNMDTTSTGSLLLLQNESADRFRVNARGDVKAAGCFGPTLVGLTVTGGTAGAYFPDVGSYYAADNKCNTDYPGAHVCSQDEMLQSMSCNTASDPIRTLGGQFAWYNGGAPGDAAVRANDCGNTPNTPPINTPPYGGWTTRDNQTFGRVWIFDNATGGRGTLTGCNAPAIKFACCK